jgi:hypothetical protein
MGRGWKKGEGYDEFSDLKFSKIETHEFFRSLVSSYRYAFNPR